MFLRLSKNGLKAIQDGFNNSMWNIRKMSVGGRDSGLVARFNEKSKKIIMDGATHRKYVAYSHLQLQEIQDIIVEKLEMK